MPQSATTPTCQINGINIFNIIEVLTEIDPNDELEYGDNTLLTPWLEKNGAVYYARPKESFNLVEAADKAIAAGESGVVIEDMS